MSSTVPEPKGYSDEGKCSNCNHDKFGESEEYEHPETEEKVKDIYCKDCGVVLEIKETSQ